MPPLGFATLQDADEILSEQAKSADEINPLLPLLPKRVHDGEMVDPWADDQRDGQNGFDPEQEDWIEGREEKPLAISVDFSAGVPLDD